MENGVSDSQDFEAQVEVPPLLRKLTLKRGHSRGGNVHGLGRPVPVVQRKEEMRGAIECD